MPSSDPQPPAEPELVWLLHSTLVWALTGALMTIARRPAWSAIGVVLTVLGLGVAGWVVRRLLHQRPPRQPTNRVFPPSQHQVTPEGSPRAVEEGAMSVFQPDPESGQPTASEQR
jgi:hypothetical protein